LDIFLKNVKLLKNYIYGYIIIETCMNKIRECVK